MGSLLVWIVFKFIAISSYGNEGKMGAEYKASKILKKHFKIRQMNILRLSHLLFWWNSFIKDLGSF